MESCIRISLSEYIDPDQSQRSDHSGRNEIWREPFPPAQTCDTGATHVKVGPPSLCDPCGPHGRKKETVACTQEGRRKEPKKPTEETKEQETVPSGCVNQTKCLPRSPGGGVAE